MLADEVAKLEEMAQKFPASQSAELGWGSHDGNAHELRISLRMKSPIKKARPQMQIQEPLRPGDRSAQGYPNCDSAASGGSFASATFRT